MIFRRLAFFTLIGVLVCPPLFFSTWTAQNFEIVKILTFRILLSLTTLFWILDSWYHQKITIIAFQKNKWIFWSILSLGFFYLISTIFSLTPGLSFWGSYARHQGLYSFLHYIWFFGLFLLIRLSSKELRQISGGVIIVATLVAFYAILQSLNWDFLITANRDQFLGRVFSTLGHPNLLGQYLALLIPFSFIFLFALSSKVIRFGVVISLFIQFSALFLSGNRASWLAVFIALTITGIFYFHIRKKNLMRNSLMFCVGIMLTIPIVLNTIIPIESYQDVPILNRLSWENENERSFLSRFYLLPPAWELILNRPLSGYGLETFSFVYPQVMPVELFTTELFTQVPDRAHNEITDLTFALGFPGLVAYLSLYGSLIFLCFRSKTKLNLEWRLGLGAVFISSFITNQFGFSLTVQSIYFWFFLAILMAFIFNNTKVKTARLSVGGNFIFSVLILLTAINVFLNLQIGRADFSLQKFNDQSQFNSVRSVSLLEKTLPNVLKLNPFYYEYQYHVASLYLQSGRPELIEKAILLLEKSKLKNPYHPNVYLLLGKARMDLGEISKANESYERSAKLFPLNPRLWWQWGNDLYLHQEYQNAILKYEKLLSFSPDYWQWTKTELSEKSEYEQTQYRLFFKHNPTFWEVIRNLGAAYRALGEEEKSEWYEDRSAL